MNAPRRCPALLISAPASGQGKTTVTAALARYHRQRGRHVRVFKTGPDFLDPTILEQASGNPVYQLDVWMGGEAHCRQLLYDAAGSADLILIEGVMGLFDGEASSADLAARLGIPVLAVIDAAAMAQTFGALAYGLANYRADISLAGVFANSVAGEGHYEMLVESLAPVAESLAKVSDVPSLGASGRPLSPGASEEDVTAGALVNTRAAWEVAGTDCAEVQPGLNHVRRFPAAYGWLPRDAGIALAERHLGLTQALEIADLDARIERAAAALQLAQTALPAPVVFKPEPVGRIPKHLAGVRVAVARDAAFSFLYRANLDVLRTLGAELIVFSPLADSALPSADSLYLPGGYPELHLNALERNNAMADAIRAHHTAGKPIVAECGGMLYLLDSLTDVDGRCAVMVGLLPGHGAMQRRLGNLGMHSATFPEGALRGHTFHYSQMDMELEPLTYSVPARINQRAEPVFRCGRLQASYLHFYFPSDPAVVARLFAPSCRS